MRDLITLVENANGFKPGWYEVLQQWIPAKILWTCGDGCCSDWNYEACEEYAVGSIIYVDEESIGNATYEVGSDYEGRREEPYRIMNNVDYVGDGILKPVEAPVGG